MITRLPSRVALSLLLATAYGCDKKDEKDPSSAAGEEASSSESSSGKKSGRKGKRMPSIEISELVPAEAAGVLVVRTPESMFAAIASFDMLGEADTDDIETLRKELDDFLEAQIGLKLTDVDALTGFFIPDKGAAGILAGTKGKPKGKAVGEHEGVTLIGLDGDDFVAAAHDDGLLVGQREAVEAALSAAEGKGETLESKGGPLVDLITKDSRGVSLAVAVAVSRMPSELRREAEPFGVEHASFRYGGDGIEVVATGSESSMKTLATQIEGGMAMLTSMAQSEKDRAMKREDTLEGVGAIVAEHSARRLSKMLKPEVSDGQLRMEVPVRLQDPALLTAFAGVGAAIAIPAMVKYTRRAKTSEARVQIAKMFDAASAYFNEEHVDRGATVFLGGGGMPVDSAPHKCPNNGSLSGSAGTTPPISVDCSQGPDGRCVPVAGRPSEPWEYDISLWTDNEVWNGLNFMQEMGHSFHYNFVYTNTDSGYGSCQFTAQAFGDLDGDGVFSTYERSGAADEHGVNAAAGLYIDKEVE
ncbi:MAG: hypothetical protein AAF799_17090 [Myxococcota bacterium]